jgi:hypothetical protein
MKSKPTLSLPPGWTSEDLADRPGFTLIRAPHGSVMVDYKMRVYRAGSATTGRPLNTKMYGGRGWREQLAMDAIAWLVALERRP